MNLKNLQQNFISGVSSDNKKIVEQINNENINPDNLIKIYNNNTISALTNALRLTYPTIDKLVGEKFFDFACRQYIKENLPPSGNLDDYGENFSNFLENLEQAKTLPYLPDIARMEWLIHQSGISDKREILDQNRLTAIPHDKFFNLRFTLHPSAYLFTSKYPVYSIWEFSESEETENANILDKGGENILILRPQRKAKPFLITSAEYLLLKNLAEGVTLYEAFDQATSSDEDFDLAFYLRKHILNGAFSNFSL